MTLLMLSVGLGTTLAFLSTHWLLAWVGLEISTLAILPLMTSLHHPRATEAATKYFLIQATGTALLFFATLLNSWDMNTWEITQIKEGLPTLMVTLALALKLGLVPFHLWLPEVMQGITFFMGMILATWQKLAPLALLIQISSNTHPLLITALGILSTLVAGWAGMNQTQMRKILAYSSIAHLGWAIVIIQIAPRLTLLTLGLYIIMTMAAFLTLEKTSLTKISHFPLAWVKNPTMAVNFILIMLSLAGLPPLTGFMSKWLILEELTKQNLYVPATLIALSALLSLFFYVRLCYTSALTMPPNLFRTKMVWRTALMNRPLITMTTVTAATYTLLPLSPLVVALATCYL
nr:NADH dehydrogenase subunit 2 [Hyphessobrycon amandae]